MEPKDFYITARELREIGFGRDKAYQLLYIVRAELEEQGYFLPAGVKAPRQAVLKKIGVIV